MLTSLLVLVDQAEKGGKRSSSTRSIFLISAFSFAHLVSVNDKEDRIAKEISLILNLCTVPVFDISNNMFLTCPFVHIKPLQQILYTVLLLSKPVCLVLSLNRFVQFFCRHRWWHWRDRNVKHILKRMSDGVDRSSCCFRWLITFQYSSKLVRHWLTTKFDGKGHTAG